MRKQDAQLGTPFTEYIGTKLNIEALPSPNVGMVAVATDNPTAPFGTYNGSTWIWGGGGAIASGTSDHEALTGLLGGEPNDHWHLTPSQTIGLVSGSSTTLHSHAGGATPGGSGTSVQYNDNGAFEGDDNFTWDKTARALTLKGNAGVAYIRGVSDGDSTGFVLVGGDAITPDTGGGVFALGGGAGDGTGAGGTVALVAGDGGADDGNGGSVFIGAGKGGGAGLPGVAKFIDPLSGAGAIVDMSDITLADKTYTFPDKDGTFALLSDISLATGTFLQLDQTTPEHVINGKPIFDDGIVLGVTPTVGAGNPGKIYWDNIYGFPQVDLTPTTNVKMGLGGAIPIIAGENIAAGEAVYIAGGSGSYPVVMKAKADLEERARVKGFMMNTTAYGAKGYVKQFGFVENLNTNSWNVGDLIYLSGATAGAITNVQPVAPLIQTVVGRVIVKSATVGSLWRSPSPNYPLSADHVDTHRVAGSSYHSVTDWFNTTSCGQIDGGVIADAGSQKITVTAGNGLIAIGTSANDSIVWCNWDALSATTVTDHRVTWVCVTYASGVPAIILYTGSSATDYAEPAAITYQDVFPLGYVVREGTHLFVTNNPRRIQDAQGGLIRRFHQTLPLARDERVGGLILGETGARKITLSGGDLWERQNRFLITAIDTNVTGSFSAWYRDGAGGFTEVTGVTAWDNINYDNNTGALVALDSNKYANQWWYLDTEGHLDMVYGRAEYSNSAAAQLGPVPATLPLHINTQSRLIARSTFQKSAATFVSIDTVFTNTFTSTAASTHNNLSGLQGGAIGEYYHLTSAQATDLTDGGDSTLHYHATDRNLANATNPTAASAAFDAAVKTKGDTLYALIAKGVTNGDSHDHVGGDGAQIAYSGLAGLPSLGTAAYVSTGTFQPVNANLTTIAGLTATTNNIIQSSASAWASRTLAQFLATIPIAVGSWTPSLTNTTNVAASSMPADWWYIRILSLVFGFGVVAQDPTTGGVLTTLGISIPIASNIGAITDLVGTATAVSGTGEHGGALFGDATNDRIILRTYPIGTGNQNWYCIFGYRII